MTASAGLGTSRDDDDAATTTNAAEEDAERKSRRGEVAVLLLLLLFAVEAEFMDRLKAKTDPHANMVAEPKRRPNVEKRMMI